MADAALFEASDVATFVPTPFAAGAWDPGIVHGAALTALFAGRMAPPDRTLARLTVEYLAPVPMAPLTMELREPGGGNRVQRQEAVLRSEGRDVAAATALLIRRGELELPDRALDHATPFDPAAVPALVPNRHAEKIVGHASFDSRSLLLEWLKVPGDRRPHQWISLAVPVVAGEDVHPVEVAAVASDYAQTAVNWTLPYDVWSFRNAEVTLHLAREPVGTWVGLRSESVVAPVGAGFNAGDLFDAEGRVGRTAAAVVVERRPTS